MCRRSSRRDLAREFSGEQFPVLDEARAMSDAFHKAAWRQSSIRCVSQCTRAAPRRFASRINMLDQRAADAAATHIGCDKQVLQIAVVGGCPGGSMVDGMRRPNACSPIMASAACIGSNGSTKRAHVSSVTDSGIFTS